MIVKNLKKVKKILTELKKKIIMKNFKKKRVCHKKLLSNNYEDKVNLWELIGL